MAEFFVFKAVRIKIQPVGIYMVKSPSTDKEEEKEKCVKEV